MGTPRGIEKLTAKLSAQAAELIEELYCVLRDNPEARRHMEHVQEETDDFSIATKMGTAPRDGMLRNSILRVGYLRVLMECVKRDFPTNAESN